MPNYLVAQRLSSVHFETIEAESPEAARAAVVAQLGGQSFTDCATQAVLKDDGEIIVQELAGELHFNSGSTAADALLR